MKNNKLFVHYVKIKTDFLCTFSKSRYRRPQPHSEEHYHNDDHEEYSSQSYFPKKSYNKPSYSPLKSPVMGGGGSYSPSQGYAPERWYNTMGGGYDDYGYNYDRSNPSSPSYKGPRQGPSRPRPQASHNPIKSLFSAFSASAPSSANDEEDSHPQYSYGTGNDAPEFESYAGK